MHGCVGEIEDVEDATQADCTALRPLALKLAKVYKPCALVVKKTELMLLGPGGKKILLTGSYKCCTGWNIAIMGS